LSFPPLADAENLRQPPLLNMQKKLLQKLYFCTLHINPQVRKFFSTIQTTIATVQAERESGSKASLRPFVILFITCCALLIIQYVAIDPGYRLLMTGTAKLGLDGVHDFLEKYLMDSPNNQLYRLIYWAGIIFTCYFIIPSLIVRFGFREKLSDYGLQWGTFFKDAWIYLVMLAIMFPLVYFASTTHSFQLRYPFYTPAEHESLWPNFWIWQITYLMQFFALEFFFRGFIVHGLKKYVGVYSIIIMTVPYCMIHFGKPMGEAFAAIFAGLALGMMSLKSRSVALGIFLHYSVAITMDMAALWQEGYFK